MAARAQQPAMPVIGFLSSLGASDRSIGGSVSPGLHEGGFVEGRNVEIEYAGPREKYDRLPALAADLVSHKVAAIVATGGGTRTGRQGSDRNDSDCVHDWRRSSQGRICQLASIDPAAMSPG